MSWMGAERSGVLRLVPDRAAPPPGQSTLARVTRTASGEGCHLSRERPWASLFPSTVNREGGSRYAQGPLLAGFLC